MYLAVAVAVALTAAVVVVAVSVVFNPDNDSLALFRFIIVGVVLAHIIILIF